MAALSAASFHNFLERVRATTVDQAYKLYTSSPNEEYCIPVVVTHVVAKVVEAEVVYSSRFTRAPPQKKPKGPSKYGCSMVIGMDMAGVAVALMFLGEGHFGTIASRVHQRMQPGSAYLVYPPRLGKVWKNGGIEILEIKMEDSLRPLPTSVTVWDFFVGLKNQRCLTKRNSPQPT